MESGLPQSTPWDFASVAEIHSGAKLNKTESF